MGRHALLASLALLALVAATPARAEYGDVVLNARSEKEGVRPVVFPHWFHRLRYACKVCHGDAAHGTAQLPRLATQNAAYLERQIREFTQRKRTNDNEVMHSVAERLTALEARAVAEYLASLP